MIYPFLKRFFPLPQAWLGLLAATAFAAWQLWLIRNRDPQACFRAFLNNNYFGLVVFLGLALHYLVR